MAIPAILLGLALGGGALAQASRPAASRPAGPASRPGVESALEAVRRIHGGAGPFVMAGYRIGQDAAARLNAARPAFELEVTHFTPQEVQYSCVADGVQAATGTSPGKLNFSLAPAPRAELRTVVRHKGTGRTLVYTLTPGFLERFLNVPRPRLEAEARIVAALPATDIFNVAERKED